MQNKHNYIYFPVLLIILSVITLALVLTKNKSSSNYIYINGTVTAYDISPTFTDGGIDFRVNDTAIDIGGGLRVSGESKVMGTVYNPITIGDKVEVKAIKNKSGYITLYECSSCYVRKK